MSRNTRTSRMVTRSETLTDQASASTDNTGAQQECDSDTTSAGESSDEIGIIYPTKALISPREYNVLEYCSSTTSTKLYLSMTEFLEYFDLRYEVNLNANQDVFVKLFEIYWLKTLHGMVWKGWRDIPEEQLNESDLKKMWLLDDIDGKNSKDVEQNVKFTYLRELIALKRIESWNKSHPDEQINTPKLLQYGWITLDYPKLRSYGGPFLAFENLDFIGRNDIDETPKRWQSFKRQELLLLRAGIVHNGLKRSNFCFDYDDECFIIDFGMSTVDDDRIFNMYEADDLMLPG